MKVSGKLTGDDLYEARRIVWRERYWLCLFANYMSRRMLWVLLAAGGGAAMSDWLFFRSPFILIEAIVAAIAFAVGLAWLVVRSQRPGPRDIEKINHGLPKAIDVDDTGIQSTARDDIRTFIPWSTLKGWASGVNVVLFYFVNEQFFLLSLRQLSCEDRAALRELLHQKLGSPLS